MKVAIKLKPLHWIGSSKKDFLRFPDNLQHAMGYALQDAQRGLQSEKAKTLKGFGNADVVEIIDSDASGTFRVVYTVRIADMVFVLHVFQKKSKQGIKTPQRDMDLVKSRLKQVQELYCRNF